MRNVVTVEEVAADPTNCVAITVHGDVPVESVKIFDAGTKNAWLYIQYKSGSTSSGTPAHWHTFVRIDQEV